MKRFLDSRALWIAPAMATIALFGIAAWEPSLFSSSVQPASPVSAITSPQEPALPKPEMLTFIEITGGCNWTYAGACVNVRTGPGTDYPVALKLRDGIVLKVASTTVVDGRTWYKIGFSRLPRYPERITSDWYVAADLVRPIYDIGEQVSDSGLNASSTKRIVISLPENMLRAYDGETLFMEQPISPGLELTPTPRGTFWIYRKTPDSYMQGPLPGISDQYYDLPGVPWDLYFTVDGGAIHGTYWHDHFGQPWSHGCVNMPPEQAKILYEWAELGTPVIVK